MKKLQKKPIVHVGPGAISKSGRVNLNYVFRMLGSLYKEGNEAVAVPKVVEIPVSAANQEEAMKKLSELFQKLVLTMELQKLDESRAKSVDKMNKGYVPYPNPFEKKIWKRWEVSQVDIQNARKIIAGFGQEPSSS